ncbi:unnamed protein product [Rotaria socialis]|uniref:Major facilitator superfamily (MFS) profile domain-containing protein n=1 Tax=Rotaria socialis TaxID=392032 RepID=A0A821LIY1_9BILA|nr:unnamed protein product [Rotaria socialis]
MPFRERPSCFRNFSHEILYVSVISCAQLLTQAVLGNVLVPLHIIGPAININDNNKLPWTLAAYSLTVGIFILITGRLGDVFGHKLLLIIGYVILAVFSLLPGMAAYVKDDIYFDVMRALQGIGPATLLPNAVALLARAYPNCKRKSFVFSMFGATAPIAFIMGALFRSIFAELVWWPWAQWVLAIFCVILAILAFFRYSNGIITSGSSRSVLVIGVFALIEMKTEEPIMPPSIWTVAGFPGVLACIALGWSSFGVFMYYVVQMLQVIRGVSPLLTTAMLSPIILSGRAATILVSLLYGRVPAHYLLLASMCFFCIGNTLIATLPIDQTYWAQVFVSTLLTPFGMDISFPAASLIVSNTVPIKQQGVAASMVNTVINWSISLGLGIAGTVESEMIKKGMSTLEGYRCALYAGIGLTGMGIIVALVFCLTASKPSPLKQEQSSDVTAAPAISSIVTSAPVIKDNEAIIEFPMTCRL